MPDPNTEKDETLLAFDYGTRHIGIAIGQTITKTANPLASISFKNCKQLWDFIDQLMQEWQPDRMVVGWPLNMDGTPQPLTQKVNRFIQQLERRYHRPVEKCDERLTTQEAKTQLFEQHGYRGLEKSRIDSYAAKIILESWLCITS